VVLVDNSLLSIPLLTLFKWDGKFPITMQIWERVGLVREAVRNREAELWRAIFTTATGKTSGNATGPKPARGSRAGDAAFERALRAD